MGIFQGISLALQPFEFMISNMSPIWLRKKISGLIQLAVFSLLLLSPVIGVLAQSKPAPKGTPPKVTVPPKSDRDKPKTSEKEERPKRP